MTLVIDATAGGATANSYVLESEAIVFAATRLNLVGWSTVTGSSCTDQEKAALIEATRELTAIAYQGVRASTEQALAWPRVCAPDPDTGSLALLYFDTTVIPQRVKNATCELAFEFLKAGTTDIASLDPSLAVLRERISVIETDYAAPSQRAQGLAAFPRALRQIAPLLAVGAGQVRLTR